MENQESVESKISLGKQLLETTTKMSTVLVSKTMETYWNLLVIQMKDASAQGLGSIEVFIKDPPFVYDRKRDVKDCSFYKLLAEKCESEALKIDIIWIHTDCSYCEDCGSGCKANKLKISWL